MPRLEGTNLGAGFVPLATIRIRIGERWTDGLAVADSGADCSIIPTEWLEGSGISFGDLPVTETRGWGAGGQFEFRLCDGDLFFREWRFATRFQVAEPGALPGMGLLGRNDFFTHFIVRFNWSANPPWFQIDPDTKAKSSGAKRRKH